MFRFIVQFFAVLIFFAVARSVLTWLARLATGFFQASAAQEHTSSGPRESRGDELLASAGELHKDPVCGTFVPGSSTWTRNVDGQTVYFCSAECRERFLVSARS